MKRGLVLPDVLFTFSFTFRKPTDNTAKYNTRPLFSTYFENPTYLSSQTFNAVFKLSNEIILFDCSVAFSSTFRHCYRFVRQIIHVVIGKILGIAKQR